MNKKFKKSDDEWKKILSYEEFQITRKGATERPFSGIYNHNKEKGVYICKCCETKLFESNSKFDSGSGWPSFFEPIDPKNVMETKDLSYKMVRIEVKCNICESHLGHIFDDGPQPSGLRYCINSISLKFVKKEL